MLAWYCLRTLDQCFLDLQCKHLKWSVFLIISSCPAPAILLNVFLNHVSSGSLGSDLRDACIIFGQQFWGLCMNTKGKPRPSQDGLGQREPRCRDTASHRRLLVPLAQLEFSLKHGKTQLEWHGIIWSQWFYRPLNGLMNTVFFPVLTYFQKKKRASLDKTYHRAHPFLMTCRVLVTL